MGSKYGMYTKDYLFSLLISGNDEEKYDALWELCKRYKDIHYGDIVALAKQHTKQRFHCWKGKLI